MSLIIELFQLVESKIIQIILVPHILTMISAMISHIKTTVLHKVRLFAGRLTDICQFIQGQIHILKFLNQEEIRILHSFDHLLSCQKIGIILNFSENSWLVKVANISSPRRDSR